MRSLFHSPFPCTQPPSQQPSPTATVSLQSEMCHRPHPAPMRRQRRSPVLLSAARPLPLGSPRPHRAHRMPPSASHLPHCVPPSASPYVATEQIPRSSPPHHDHRAPPPSYTCCASPPASRPPCADIRVTPPSLSSRCGGPRALAGKNRAVCIPFSPNARKRPPSWQHPPEMHALRDQDGNVLAPCIHSRVQSGDSGYMARESCRQGPFFASRSPKSRMARRCCHAARPFRGSGMRHGRTGFAPCDSGMRHAAWPNGLCALRRGPGLLAACAPPCHLACARRGLRPLPSRPRSSPPSYTRRASPPETRHAVPAPMHLATCAPHPSRQPRGPTASRKQAEQHKQLNAGIKIGSPNGDPIE